MSLWVIVPVKPLNRAKSRLAEVLTTEERYEFASAMLRHVLSVVTDVPQVTGTLVISRDTKALAIARDSGAKTIQESNSSNLNPALARATEVVRVWGAQAVLILPADLPFITRRDIINIAEMGSETMTVVLATDQQKDGTNALLVRPAGMIPYSYGNNSYDSHLKSARQAGMQVKEYVSETIMLDIDVPLDLKKYNDISNNGHHEELPELAGDNPTSP